jgi:glycosyltransferase involved in cell wall biosynthesis
VKILIETRPALDGFSGIPQETRLTFLGLAREPGFDVEGLLQSGNLLLPAALPIDARAAAQISDEEALDRLGNVVTSLQQHQQRNRFGRIGRYAKYGAAALGWIVAALTGRAIRLTRFKTEHFEDFVWTSFFAKSLAPEDRPYVAGRPHRIIRVPWSLAHWIGVATSRLGLGLYPRVDTRGVDVVIAETPFPGRVSPGTTLVIRYHDSVPLLLPHTIRNMHHHRSAHLQALRRNVRDGAWFACVSDAVREELTQLLPEAGRRAVTIPNIVSHHFFPQDPQPERIDEIIWSRRNRDAPFSGGQPWPTATSGEALCPYLLMVGTLEPRKNHATLIAAWEALRGSGHRDLQLVFVGSLGWQYESILRNMKPWLERGGIHLLQAVPADELRLLYRHALLTVCPSVAEGFDFPGVEAMRSGGAVLASDVHVHRDVFADGAEYFDPYSAPELAQQIIMLRSDEQARIALRERGLLRAEQYLASVIAPRWSEFLSTFTASARNSK